MKVLVTGASGFVGSHLVEQLLKEKYEVVALVRRTSNLIWLDTRKIELRYGEINEKPLAREILSGIDAVIHCAGLVRSIQPEDFYRINHLGTAQLLKTIKQQCPGLKKFIFISSQAVYGPAKTFRYKKVGEEAPVSDYGKSKLLAEQELKKYSGQINWTIFRPASVYGPRDRDIRIFFQLINRGWRLQTLSAKFFQLVFVSDLAKIIVRDLGRTDNSGQIYFVAEPEPYSLNDIGKIIALAAGKKTIPLIIPDFLFLLAGRISEFAATILKQPATFNYQKSRELIQRFWLADTSETLKDFPDFCWTQLTEGAKITYNWYRENQCL